MYKIIFLGTPDFAVPTLETLVADERFDVVAVVTAPDAPVGRKQILTPPPVKITAQKHGIPVLQPNKPTDIREQLAASRPDCMVTIAYGYILPQSIIDIPTHGIVNLHASILPRWRGASPIQSAIAAGDKETGITLMKIDAGCDTGPIIAIEKLPIELIDTGASLHDKLSVLSAEVTKKHLIGYLESTLQPVAQDQAHATLAGKLTRESGRIDWQKPAVEIERLVRAYYPWPGTWTQWNGKTLKIIAVKPGPLAVNKYEPGTVFVHDGKLAVQCGNDALAVTRLQLEGKKPMDAQEFIRGNQEIINTRLT